MSVNNAKIDIEKLNEMRKRILELEKTNSRTKQYKNAQMINQIVEIIIEEDGKCY